MTDKLAPHEQHPLRHLRHRGGRRTFNDRDHRKMVIIDSREAFVGIWSAIGSTNFDDRSFDTNDEITLGILDAGIAKRLDDIFEKYGQRCEEIEREKWQKRGWWHKLKDNVFYMLNEVL